MAITKKPAPEFLPEENSKKSKGLFNKLSANDPEKEHFTELRKKAADSVFETSHIEKEDVQVGPSEWQYFDKTVIDHKLTSFGKQYIFDNEQLYWQVPEKFRTESMRTEMAMYRPELLYFEGFELSDSHIIQVVFGPLPQDLPKEEMAALEATKKRLITEGVLQELQDPEQAFYDVLDYCREMEDIPSEVKQWLQKYDYCRTEQYLESSIEELIRYGDAYYLKQYEKIRKDFENVHSEEKLHEKEKKVWTRNLKQENIFSPFIKK